MPADIVSEVRSILISIFPRLTISEKFLTYGIVPYRRPAIFVDDIGGQSDGGGMISNRRSHDFVQLYEFSRLGARVVGTG
jgi:hypothetical protein